MRVVAAGTKTAVRSTHGVTRELWYRSFDCEVRRALVVQASTGGSTELVITRLAFTRENLVREMIHDLKKIDRSNIER